ncbi:hypothetical protein [Sediminibacillus terrae]|uniref:hypothetical protein n=1 Tax=Sediminibacillus terrae TaxID=1562106 RepID=UPI0012979D55|nr:hypothetical protein [Sediminibacillus terrae]
MFNTLREVDFAGLRGPFKSGRQSPTTLGAVLLFAVCLQALLLYLEYFVGQYSIYPNKELILKVHLWACCIIAFFSVIYSIPLVFYRSQKIQYLLSIIVSQNLFGVSAYILGIMVLGTETENSQASLITFTFITFVIGVLVFSITNIRLLLLLIGGKYKIGFTKYNQRNKLENNSFTSLILISGVGILFILQYLVRNIDWADIETIFMVTLAVVLFYAMLFVLPEQLVILYCKYRFDSFNYEQNGRLKPIRDQGGNIVDENVDEDISYKELYEEMED